MEQRSIPRKNTSHIKNLLRGTQFFKDLSILHWAALGLSGLCISATILLSLAIPITQKVAINALETYTPTQSLIWPLAFLGLYAGAWLARQVAIQFREICAVDPFEHLVTIIARRIFTHTLRLPMNFHMNRQLNTVTGLFKKAQLNISIIYIVLLYWVIPLLIESLGAVYIVFKLYGWFFSLVLAFTLVCYGLSIHYFSDITKAYRTRFLDTLSRANFRFLDTFLHTETVKAFCQEEAEKKRFHELCTQTAVAQERYGTLHTSMHLIEAIILGLGITFFSMRAASLVADKTFALSDFVMLHGYVLQFALPLSVLGHSLRYLQTGLIDLGSIFDALDLPIEQDSPDAKPIINPSGRITLEHISFSYTQKNHIFKDFSCTIPAGSTVGLVGISGSGKSTISKLISRYYKPNSGAILIDGMNIKDITKESLRSIISSVPQECTLFNDTLYFNIAYSNPNATPEEVFNAARAAQLEDFVKTLPHQYETLIGERGMKLSGGERQRVAIARALLKKDARIYIFDEATSALDNTTELNIQNNIRAWCKDTTTLIVAHRLSTIIHADIILFLENGAIIEQGSHQHLLELNGKYAATWHQQQQKLNQDASQ